ncbi:MAG: pentapeptide repeat-containing protein [Aquabacterium sp.]|nr:pentapeptide repeat-containing protein [Aquabacterium sp.]
MTPENFLDALDSERRDFSEVVMAGMDLPTSFLRRTHPEFFNTKLSDLFRLGDPSIRRPMRRLDLSGVVFDFASLVGCRFSRVNLSHSSLVQADARGGNFSGAIVRDSVLTGADLSYSVLRNCDFSGANLSGCKFDFAELVNVNFTGANLNGASFNSARLWGPIFGSTKLTGCDFSGAILNKVKFGDVSFIGCLFNEARLDAVEFVGGQISGSVFDRAFLSGATFRSVLLKESQFKSARLSNVKFAGANLKRVSFAGADLIDTVFISSSGWRVGIDSTNMVRVKFSGCNFQDVYAHGAHFSQCDLGSMINFGYESLYQCTTDYPSVALTVARNPANPLHANPYSELIGFLGKCGMPTLAATYIVDAARALTQGEIWSLMQSTFISYGHPDENFASLLSADLSKNGVRTFFFPLDAEFGEKLHKTMRRVNDYDRTILICSRQSLDRKGLQYELEKVIEREAREGGGSLLIPITLDDYVFTSWVPEREELKNEILSRVVADFRSTSDYNVQLGRLLKALRK